MQLIVAVLTFTFETASRSGRIHYFLGIIDNLRNLEYDGVCGTLVTFPIVGSIFNIFFILTHMFADPDPALKVALLIFFHTLHIFFEPLRNRILTRLSE